MRLVGLGLATVWASSAAPGPVIPTVGEDEACIFLGARFAHTRSTCEPRSRVWLCSGLHVGLDGKLWPGEGETGLLCDEARTMMRNHLVELAAVLPSPGSRFVPNGTLSNAGDAIWLVRVGLEPDYSGLVRTLAAASNALWALAAWDWRSWRSGLGPLSVERHIEALEGIMEDELRNPVWSAERRRAVSACMFWMFDLVALGASPNAVRRGRPQLANVLLFDTVPGYRPVHSLESVEQSPRRDWNVWAGALLDNRPVAESVVRDFIRVWSGDSAASLADAARVRAVSLIVCTEPARRIREYPEPHSFARRQLLNWGVHLLDFCARGGSQPAWREAQTLVSDELLGRAVSVPSPLSLNCLIHQGIEVAKGLAGARSVEENRRVALALVAHVTASSAVLVEGRFRLVSEVQDHQVPGFTISLVVFARACGLALRYGADLGSLGLAPQLVRLLHPRMRARTSLAAAAAVVRDLGIGEANLLSFVQAVEAVSSGMAEGLGPAGMSLIDDASWLALFTQPVDGPAV